MGMDLFLGRSRGTRSVVTLQIEDSEDLLVSGALDAPVASAMMVVKSAAWSVRRIVRRKNPSDPFDPQPSRPRSIRRSERA